METQTSYVVIEDSTGLLVKNAAMRGAVSALAVVITTTIANVLIQKMDSSFQNHKTKKLQSVK